MAYNVLSSLEYPEFKGVYRTGARNIQLLVVS
jgi:hypothetical protein